MQSSIEDMDMNNSLIDMTQIGWDSFVHLFWVIGILALAWGVHAFTWRNPE